MADNSAAAGASNIPDFEYLDVNTTVFHIGSFRDEWLRRLRPCDYSHREENPQTFDENFAKEMGIDEETMSKLKSMCSVDSLRCHPVDDPPDPDVVPPDPILKTLIHRKKKEDRKVSRKGNRHTRHDVYADELERLTVGAKAEKEVDVVAEGDVIVTLNIYYGRYAEKFNGERPHVTLLMTGSHTLAELRDAICCVSDLQVTGEFSNTPDMVPDFINKDHFKSAYFFFEGVFYNDMRFPECQDLSSTVIEWAKSHNFPPYTQAKMEDTRLVDLKIKVGFPYLYCHQGDCEHLVILTDVRLAHKNDCLIKSLYPLVTHKHRVITRKCAVCNSFIGRWLTTNDQFAPSHPCLFCDKCFRMLHYDAEGKRLGEFQAYPYVDRGAFN